MIEVLGVAVALLGKVARLLELAVAAAKRGQDPRTVMDVWKENEADAAREAEREAARKDFLDGPG